MSPVSTRRHLRSAVGGEISSLCWEWMSSALQESPFTQSCRGHGAMAGTGDPAGLETHRDSAALPKHPLEEWSRKWQRNLGKIISNSQKAVKKGGGRCEGTERQLMCESSLNWHPKSKKNLCCDVLRLGKKRSLLPVRQVSQRDLLWICFENCFPVYLPKQIRTNRVCCCKPLSSSWDKFSHRAIISF